MTWSDFSTSARVSLVGALLAGTYGALHDQWTFSISPEYFTKLKFKQFSYADVGGGDVVFASTVGILATWWVGVAAAWIFSRWYLPNQPREIALRNIRVGFVFVFTSAVLFAIAGYAYGLWRGPHADYSAWEWAIERFKIDNHWAFVRVAYIHNAGYLGGVFGLIITLLLFRRTKLASDNK